MRKIVSPQTELYDTLSSKQLSYLANCLDARHEIPLQFEYLGKGAHIWDVYATRMMAEESTNTINSSPRLLAKNYSYIDGLVASYTKVNVIDVTIGNVMPAKDFLGHLLAAGKDITYIGLDYSPEILKLAEHNIKKWFQGKVHFRAHEVDLNTDRFNGVLEEYTLENQSSNTVNIVLFLGGTHHNFTFIDSCFQTIYESLGKHDFLVTSSKLDSSASRKFFDFHPEISGKNAPLTPDQIAALDTANLHLLGIESTMYEIEYGFDANLFQRYIQARLKCDVTIVLKLQNGKRLIHFKEGDAIRLVKIQHQTKQDMLDLLDRTGFSILQASHTEDQHYLLTISRIKRA